MHDDSAIRRLANARKGEEAFLSNYQLAAADRLERMIVRAQLAPRLTMSYDPAQSGGGRRGAGNSVAAMTDTAAEARQKLNRLAAAMPADCWNIAFDVCGLGKGLQTIETERGWPRRSAKLVLRIALEQLASQFGLAPHRVEKDSSALRTWLGERLPLIPLEESSENFSDVSQRG